MRKTELLIPVWMSAMKRHVMAGGIFCFKVITSISSPSANKHRSINPTINWSTNKRVSQSVRPTMANKQKSKQASKQQAKKKTNTNACTQPATRAHTGIPVLMDVFFSAFQQSSSGRSSHGRDPAFLLCVEMKSSLSRCHAVPCSYVGLHDLL